MSEGNVEIVRNHLAAHKGEDVLPVIKELLERIGSDPQPAAVMAALEADPGWRHLDPEIEWDMSATGMGTAARGARELAVWWGVWAAVWSTQEYEMREYRDLGHLVLSVADVHATARGYTTDPEIFQLWRVYDGKITGMWAFLSEAEAIAAADRGEATA